MVCPPTFGPQPTPKIRGSTIPISRYNMMLPKRVGFENPKSNVPMQKHRSSKHFRSIAVRDAYVIQIVFSFLFLHPVRFYAASRDTFGSIRSLTLAACATEFKH
jgi:hypothetical protein